MKFIKFTILMAAMAATAMLTSCESKDDDNFDPVGDPVSVIAFNFTNYTYNSNSGMWDGCYDPSKVNDIVCAGMRFSHSVTEWAPGQFAWNGFCPSNSSNRSEHSENWLDWQWSNITGTGWMFDIDYGFGGFATGSPFMVANWNVSEDTENIPTNPSLKIFGRKDPTQPGELPEQIPFEPLQTLVTNTTYGYFGMTQGTAYSKQFTADDWCKVYFIGVRGGKKTGTVEVSLFEKGLAMTNWTSVDLTPLGTVDYIYCQMASSDSGQWGMNNPAYFALGCLMLYPAK